MSESSQYLNKVDQQLSKLVEGDLMFKRELVSIYSKYMKDIPEEFTQLVSRRSAEGVALLDHKHKTTCQVLALQQLTEVFKQTRNVLENQPHYDEALNGYVTEVTTICHTTFAQLQELQ